MAFLEAVRLFTTWQCFGLNFISFVIVSWPIAGFEAPVFITGNTVVKSLYVTEFWENGTIVHFIDNLTVLVNIRITSFCITPNCTSGKIKLAPPELHYPTDSLDSQNYLIHF